jgi:hypothetical protein
MFIATAEAPTLIYPYFISSCRSLPYLSRLFLVALCRSSRRNASLEKTTMRLPGWFRLRALSAATLVLCRQVPFVTSVQVELDNEGNAAETETLHNDNLECGLWVAPSTIKGAGLGLFAGVDFKENQEFLPGGDLAVPIVDFTTHNAPKMGLNVHHTNQSFLWNDYIWGANSLMENEGVMDASYASEGFGAVANCFIPLHNVEVWHPRQVDTGLHRARDAGAGASSLFHQRKSTARHDVEAGSELFLNCTLFAN